MMAPCKNLVLLCLLVAVIGLHVPHPEAKRRDRKAKATCGGTIKVSKGESRTFESPNYPDNYPAKSKCKWKFKVKEEVEVNCDVMDLAVTSKCSDYLQFKTKNNKSKFCGSSLSSLTLTSKKINVLFKSHKRSKTAPGFSCTIGPKSECHEQTLPPCKALNGTCLSQDAYCNGREVTNDAFCNDSDTCKCCFPKEPCDCKPHVCHYNGEPGTCSQNNITEWHNVGEQGCKNGCECYVPYASYCWSNASTTSHIPDGFTGTIECGKYTCINGNLTLTAILADCEFGLSTSCYSIVTWSYFPHGHIGSYLCVEYTCINGNWTVTGAIKDCKTDSPCWAEATLNHFSYGTVGGHECIEYTCINGNWTLTDVLEDDCGTVTTAIPRTSEISEETGSG